MKLLFKGNIANIITILRIIFSIALIFTSYSSFEFYFFYTLAGISDMLDGLAARKYNIASVLGAGLDSMADIVFTAAVFVKIIPAFEKIESGWIVFIILIGAARILGYIIGILRFQRAVAHHTILNKFTGLLLFLFIYFLNTAYLEAALGIVCFISLASSLEELLISILEEKYNPDIKSIFDLHSCN